MLFPRICRIALFAVLLLPVPAAAQAVVHGVVTDSLTGEPLPGANVYFPELGNGSATDLDGAYRISGITAGTHIMRVSYLGYESRELELTLARGDNRRVAIALVAATAEGEEIVVTAQAEGQVAAINQQLSANTIVNVVSEAKIQELPDANAAEAIGRLPGVAVQRSGGEASQIVLRGLSGTFTSITVDGVKIAPTDADARSVDLSAISQGSLSGIELFKALTPDKDADAIAGSVNLVTRRAPATRQLRVNVVGGYNGLAQDYAQYDADFRYGARFLEGALGVQLTGNLERRNRSSEEYDLDYDISVNDYTSYFIEDLFLNYTDETRRRGGLGTIVDLTTPDDGVIKLSALYNHTSRDYIVYGRNYPTGGDLIFYGARDREQEIDLFNGALTGENYVLGLEATWGASYARSTSSFPFDYEVSFTEPSETDATGNVTAGMQSVPGDVRRGAPEEIIPFAVNNFDKAYLYSAFFRGEESTDTDRSGFLNLGRDYALGGSVRGALKVGGKYRDKRRSRDRSEQLAPYYNETFPQYVMQEDGTVVQKDFTGTAFSDLRTSGQRILATNFLDRGNDGEELYDRFRLYPIFDRDAVRSWYDLNRRGYTQATGVNPEYEANIEADGYFYDISERVAAGYVMNTVSLGQRVTWVAGLRVEHENNDYASRYSPEDLGGFPVPTGSIRDTSAAYAETIWLPNMHLTIRPTGFMNIRLAAYRALARPNFNQRLANAVARQSGTFYPGNSLVLGNPNLRTAKAWNYELATSFYGSWIGLFTVSAFYKDIEDMYHLINGLPFNNAAVLDDFGVAYENPFGSSRFSLTLPFNSAHPTTVYGLELEHQTNFRYLPGPLGGIVLGYNLSFIRSSTYIPAVRRETTYIERPPFPPVAQVEFVFEENEQKLEEQPDFLANLSLGYDYRGFSGRLSMFHQGEYYTRFSSDGRNDGLRGAFTRWDLAFKQRINDRVFLLLNVNNLTSVEETAISYNSLLNRRLLSDSHIYGTTVDLGIRFDL